MHKTLFFLLSAAIAAAAILAFSGCELATTIGGALGLVHPTTEAQQAAQALDTALTGWVDALFVHAAPPLATAVAVDAANNPGTFARIAVTKAAKTKRLVAHAKKVAAASAITTVTPPSAT